MRWVIAALLAGVTTLAHADSCPVRRITTKAPALRAVRDVAAARALLLKTSTGMEQEVDIVEPATTERAFKADVRRAVEHGGVTSFWDSSAVFVLAKRVVVVPHLVKWALVIPQECAPDRQDEVLDVKLVSAGKRSLGVVRVRRVGTRDATSLPSVAPRTTDASCAKTAIYRIEDHVFDLDKRRELLVLAAAYEGPIYEEHAPPLTTLQLSETAATVPDSSCKAFSLRP